MSTRTGITTPSGRTALLLGATALALAGVIAAVHLATAHRCLEHPADADQCAVCLHLQHHAAEQIAVSQLTPPLAPGDVLPTTACAPGSARAPAATGRAPPASVVSG